MKPYLIGRAMDVGLIAALFLGNADVRTFCFWVISVLWLLMMLGVLTMNAEMAKAIYDLPTRRKVLRIVVAVLYTAALIYAGFPALAALYIVASLLLLAAAQACKQKVNP